MREWRSVRELSDKQKKKTKKTLDTAGVVRDGRLSRPSENWLVHCTHARLSAPMRKEDSASDYKSGAVGALC